MDKYNFLFFVYKWTNYSSWAPIPYNSWKYNMISQAKSTTSTFKIGLFWVNNQIQGSSFSTVLHSSLGWYKFPFNLSIILPSGNVCPYQWAIFFPCWSSCSEAYSNYLYRHHELAASEVLPRLPAKTRNLLSLSMVLPDSHWRPLSVFQHCRSSPHSWFKLHVEPRASLQDL